ALATHHLEDILAVQPQAPYLIAGYSTGGLIAWEIAQQLRAMGKEVALLAILDTDGPHRFYQTYLHWNCTLRSKWDKLTQLPIAEQLSILSQKIAKKTSLSTEEHIADPYLVQPYPDRVTLFLATKADRGNFFSHKIKLGLCPRAGWDEARVPQLKIEQVPGDHFNMLEEPHVKVLGTKLKQYLTMSNEQ
ncbi:MAG: hypothetical protein RLZZ381_1846, partial [Cyanobacteriota bacterium]